MSYKFFYLYLAGGTLALIFLIVQVMAWPSDLSEAGIFINLIPVLLLYYLAYKVRREKDDQDLM
ncbi:MAG TPA: hypothetical protein VK668_09915 [Mucilaginibacter sp.]|nr:hypothetical protein [Mucilaginibacter sp.]